MKGLVEAMWDLEAELGLLEHTLRGVHAWANQRMVIYYALARQLGVFATAHADVTRRRDVLGAPWMLRDLVARDALRGDYTRRLLVFDHSRKVKVGDAWRDIYTHALLARLPAEDVDVYESVYQGRHLTPREPNRKYLDALGVAMEVAERVPVRWDRAERAFIQRVQAAIKARVGVDFDVGERFARELRTFSVARRYYTRLLRKRQPERVFLVVDYGAYKRGLVAAARGLGVESVEIQHGTLSRYHLGYSYPRQAGGPTPPWFPDRLWTFGRYWGGAAPFPLTPDRIEPYGFPHFTEQRAAFEGEARDPKQVLFISQGVIGARLSEVFLQAARAMPDRRFIYKLHPGEYPIWRSDMPALVAAAALPNVQVIDHNEVPLYAWFARSAVQVGAFSTALYEGLAFGCRTVLIDLPGTEYMADLVAQGDVELVPDAAGLQAALAADRAVQVDPDRFFHPHPERLSPWRDSR